MARNDYGYDRRRPRQGYDEDDIARLRRRRRKPRDDGKIIAITVGGLVAIGVVVAVVVLIVNRGGIRAVAGPADISWQKFLDIKEGATLEDLENRFGPATRIDRDVLDRKTDRGGWRPDEVEDLRKLERDYPCKNVRYGPWYCWKRGPEAIYVSANTLPGQPPLFSKLYTNSTFKVVPPGSNERIDPNIARGLITPCIDVFKTGQIER